LSNRIRFGLEFYLDWSWFGEKILKKRKKPSLTRAPVPRRLAPGSDPGAGGLPIDAAHCFLAGYSTGGNIGDLDHVVFELRSVYDDAS